jgi:hypothetical protein
VRRLGISASWLCKLLVLHLSVRTPLPDYFRRRYPRPGSTLKLGPLSKFFNARISDEDPLIETLLLPEHTAGSLQPDRSPTWLPQTTATPVHADASLLATISPFLQSSIQKLNTNKTAHNQGQRRVFRRVLLLNPSPPLQRLTPRLCHYLGPHHHGPMEDGRHQA